MKPFKNLSLRGKWGRLRHLAKRALVEYRIDSPSLRPQLYHNNATFRVDAAPSASDSSSCEDVYESSRFLLRISRPGFHDSSKILSELQWLVALHTDTELTVPSPVPTVDGSWIVSPSVNGVPEARHCVLFKWIRGRCPGYRIGRDSYRKVGVFLGRLHSASFRFVSREGFQRKVWNHDTILGGEPSIDRDAIKKFATREDQSNLDAFKDLLAQTLGFIGKGSDRYGMIHGDFQYSNYLMRRERIAAIDFDDSGWGHYAYDIAVNFSRMERRNDFQLMRESFLSGYRSVFPLPNAFEQYLHTLIVARHLHLGYWNASTFGGGKRVEENVRFRLRRLKFFMETRN